MAHRQKSLDKYYVTRMDHASLADKHFTEELLRRVRAAINESKETPDVVEVKLRIRRSPSSREIYNLQYINCCTRALRPSVEERFARLGDLYKVLGLTRPKQ